LAVSTWVNNIMVTVTPGRLKEALNAKLGDAAHALAELREADKPERNRYWNERSIVVDFLYAARGVFPVVKTFGEDNLQPAGFRQWCDAWEGALGRTELGLWRKMNDERISQEHGEGAELMPVMIPIAQVDVLPQDCNVALLGLAARGYRPATSKGGVRFTAYPNRAVSEVCAEYKDLAQRFVDDFVRGHANLIP
jgi:hypothetical protein